MGYINTVGEEVIPLHYEDNNNIFMRGLAAVKLNGRWGVIDLQTNQIVPFEYEAISEFKDGYAIVAKKHVEVDDNTTIAEELQQSLSNDSTMMSFIFIIQVTEMKPI